MIQHDEIKFKDFQTIFVKFLETKDIVRFGLFCAEDVYEFNDESTKPLAKKCINLVKQWLIDPESVTISQLSSTASSPHPGFHSIGAAISAVHATYCVADLSRLYTIIHAANVIYHASRVSANYEQERYECIALSYLSKSNIQTKPMMGKLLDKNDYTSILALFDELEESQEDIIQQLPDGYLRLNSPQGQDITGKDKIDLAKQIILPNNSWIVDWLQRLYT